MKNTEKAELTKELIRAQDALQRAFSVAAAAHELDVAADLRKRRIALGRLITDVNGGPPEVSRTELLGAFR